MITVIIWIINTLKRLINKPANNRFTLIQFETEVTQGFYSILGIN